MSANPNRYERKYLVEGLDARQVCSLVLRHPALFHRPYPPRYINNIYLDSTDLRNYRANLDGHSEREKVRIRWYGDLMGEIRAPVLEFKVKHGLVGQKFSYPFPALQLQPGYSQADFQRAIRAADLPTRIKQRLRNLEPVLCNRYYRWYFATRDGKFRATVDAQMCYYPISRQNSRFRPHSCADRQVVLELKYGQTLETQADRISSFFPFTLSRNSKYVSGIERVYIQL